MENPHLKDVLANFPDVVAKSLPWPAGADTWTAKELELFIGSGGFLKPKKKAATPTAPGVPVEPAVPDPVASGTAGVATSSNGYPAEKAEDSTLNFEMPNMSKERHRITMPVRVHCEDTAPNGHVRLESLVAYAERIRSLALKQIMGISLADLKEKNLAILATEFVVEIVGQGIRVLDTLRIDTTPEFPAAPLFPWDTEMFTEDGTLYMRGLFGLNLCQISGTGAYSGVDEATYRTFTKDLKSFSHPSTKKRFSATSLRFFMAYEKAGEPFTPEKYKQERYRVRSADCDMYNVLFQARVPSMMEACRPGDALSFYVNIRMSVRPGDDLQVHVFENLDSALFICLRGKEPVLTAVGRYVVGPISQEEIKCASIRLPLLLKFCTAGEKPSCEDFDLSKL